MWKVVSRSLPALGAASPRWSSKFFHGGTPLVGILLAVLSHPAEICAAENAQASVEPKTNSSPYAMQPAFKPLRFGDVKPRGWILAQMERDLATGFAGHLDELCHEASTMTWYI